MVSSLGSGVNLLYLVLLFLGLLYAIFLLISGQIGSDGTDAIHHDFEIGGGHDTDLHLGDADHPHGLSPISPLTIATFVTAFGATGLIATGLFNASDRMSLLWAALGGVLFSVMIYVGFTYLFIKPQGSSEVRIADLAGTIAEIITPIPENGTGEIAFVAQGGRMTYSARNNQKGKIDRGTSVRILRIVGGIAYVEPIIE
jgi:membrane protein implicated in regulation of membrane protease activity